MSSLPTEAAITVQKPKHTMLPILVVLFLISYGLLTMLVVEQGRTIESQRSLIRNLFSDTGELSALKGKIFQEQRKMAKSKGGSHAQAQAPPAPSAPAQAAPQGKTRTMGDAGKSHKAVPQKPPKVEEEIGDVRRANVSI